MVRSLWKPPTTVKPRVGRLVGPPWRTYRPPYGFPPSPLLQHEKYAFSSIVPPAHISRLLWQRPGAFGYNVLCYSFTTAPKSAVIVFCGSPWPHDKKNQQVMSHAND